MSQRRDSRFPRPRACPCKAFRECSRHRELVPCGEIGRDGVCWECKHGDRRGQRPDRARPTFTWSTEAPPGSNRNGRTG